jgi:transposase
MTEPGGLVLFAGIDWATEKHDVCLVDPSGRVLEERAFPATAEGLATLADWLLEEAGGEPPEKVAVGIEVPHGPLVETLVERGFAVHSINPKQLDRFRDRFTVSGAKDDRRDARVLADSLRTDPRAYRRLSTEDPGIIELREWSRMADDLQRERNILGNRTREQLRRFYPQALELTEDVCERWFLDLMEVAPTPADAHRLRPARVAKILKARRIRRLDADTILRVLRGPAVHVAPGTVEAATSHLRLLRVRLHVVQDQLTECNARLDAICKRLGAEGESGMGGRENEPRVVEILRSMPGAGRIIAATMLAEASRPLLAGDYQALRTLTGIAPVTRRSGKSRIVVMRKACNPRLRNALYHWARVAAICDPAWQRFRNHLPGSLRHERKGVGSVPEQFRGVLAGRNR